MVTPATPPTTRREREILHVIFALGNQATADQIRQKLTEPPGDSSVRVMLGRMERKGLLQHAQDGLRYVYSATHSPALAKQSAVKELVNTFFKGSTIQLLTALVRQGTWSDDELDALDAAIERVRSNRSRSDRAR